MTRKQPLDQPARDQIRSQLDQTLFVQAGAGTGKTTALVARVVELIATGRLASISGLAAITFNENAAAELRNRIREALQNASRGKHNEREFDATEVDRCRLGLRQLDDAAISTLHGFAARILTDHAIEAGLSPGFAVRDAVAARLDALAAWRDYLDDLLDDPATQPHLIAALTLGLKLDDLRKIVDEFSGNWDLLLSRPFTAQPLPRISAERVLVALRRAAAYADIGPEDDKLTTWLRDNAVVAAAELESLTDSHDLLDALSRTSFSSGNSGVVGNWEKVGLSKTDVTELLAEAETARQDLVISIARPAVETLAAGLQGFVLAQAERRRLQAGLDFHDLLVRSRDLLRVSAQARRDLHELYPVVLVDEFQDTDPLQVEIVCLIAGECGDTAPAWPDVAVPDGGLFFVGDPKQSIYRFRRADVRLFTAAGEKFGQHSPVLSANFRSLPAIVDVVNEVFEELIGNAGAAQVPYTHLEAFREPQADALAHVLLLGGPDDAPAAVLREREAQQIATTVARAKLESWPLDDGRAASYGDITILLPTRTSLPAIETALQGRDIPYRVESRSLIWATDSVRDLVTLLQAVDNPVDEIATVAALRHPGLACSDVDLVGWKAGGGAWNYLAPLPTGIDAAHPVAAGMARLRELHDLRWWLPVNELAERIVRELRLVELTVALRRPRDHWRRLRFVVDQARAFCDAGGSGLGEFVAWAVDQIESDADVLETVVPEADDDAVRILTVHGSKGLEFPITIVAGLGISGSSSSPVLWGGPRPEVRPKVGLATAGYDEQLVVEKVMDDAESTRLLYVAMTRAMDYLVLGCHHKPVKKGKGSHAQRLWGLLAESPLVTVETTSPAVGECPVAEPWLVASVDRAGFSETRAKLLTEVGRRVSTSATAMVAEVTAAVAQGDVADQEPEFDKPSTEVVEIAGTPVFHRRQARTGAAIGTAVHRVLELIDFAAWTEDSLLHLTEVACAEEEIPALATQVAARVRGALGSPIVQEAARTGRYWREVFVVVPEGERFLEGYVDLLVETEAGDLVVVDYKTDRVSSAAELADKIDYYRPQLAVYAKAIKSATGRPVTDSLLLFAGVSKAQEASTR